MSRTTGGEQLLDAAAPHERPAEAVGAAALVYFPPPEPLSELFGPAYLFTCADSDIRNHTRADFGQIRFMLAGAGDYHFIDQRVRATPATCLLGPTFAATSFVLAGPARVLGLSVLPLGWAGLGLGDASIVADDVRDLVTSCGPEWLVLLQQLRGMTDAQAAIDRLWVFLAARVQPPEEGKRRFVAAADSWLTDERSPDLGSLQKRTGLGARQVSRLCNQLYGGAPKLLARKYRALRCAIELAREDRPWTELAGEDFYDQSHFIREIKHFTGLTPTELREQENIVMRLMLQRAELGDKIAELSRVS